MPTSQITFFTENKQETTEECLGYTYSYLANGDKIILTSLPENKYKLLRLNKESNSKLDLLYTFEVNNSAKQIYFFGENGKTEFFINKTINHTLLNAFENNEFFIDFLFYKDNLIFINTLNRELVVINFTDQKVNTIHAQELNENCDYFTSVFVYNNTLAVSVEKRELYLENEKNERPFSQMRKSPSYFYGLNNRNEIQFLIEYQLPCIFYPTRLLNDGFIECGYVTNSDTKYGYFAKDSLVMYRPN